MPPHIASLFVIVYIYIYIYTYIYTECTQHSARGIHIVCVLLCLLRAPKFILLTLRQPHYSDVIMSAMASQITGVPIVCADVCSSVDQRKHQSSASLAFVRGIHHSLLMSNEITNYSMTCKLTVKQQPFPNVMVC